ncbi:MAG: ppkA [Acidobacteria bacterium]|nr:ppkA [Acidobacteriota bacterium]
MTPERWQHLKSVLETAMEISPTEREVYLKNACSGDDELLREVESFLAFENAGGDVFDKPAFSTAFKELSAADAADNFVGMKIGKYRIISELGSGGMGMVFLAERTDGEFEQQVAVKILRRSFFNSSAKQKFQQERQILARLKHPYIAQLLDGGATEENTPFLVMEHVRGTPITRYAAEKNLSLSEKLDLFRKVCEAVSFAHRNLIVHRDLKPDNILINEDGIPKLLDFGIAKLLSENEINATVTRFQALTPEYASPEQITGGAITTATDIYGLGIILYELVTGQRPFAASSSNAEQLLHAIAETAPVKPSEALTKNANDQRKRETQSGVSSPDAPFFSRLLFFRSIIKTDLDNIILKALRKNPERRYKSVELFAEDIRRHLAGLPVTARPDTFLYRAEKFVSRNPLAFAATLLAFVCLSGGLLISNYQRQIAIAERAKAERRFKDVRALANSFMFEINEKIDESPIKARELLVMRAIEYLDKLAAEADSDITLQSELATAYEKIGDVQSEIFKPGLGNSQGAYESHRKALQMREIIYSRSPQDVQSGLELAQSYVKIGNVSSMIGNTASAVEYYNKAVALHEKLLSIEPENVQLLKSASRSYAMLGQAILRSGSLSNALNYYEKAISTIKRVIEDNPGDLQLERLLSAYYSYAGYAKLEIGGQNEALRFFSDALAIEEKVLETDPNNKQYRASLAIAELWVGIALRSLNRMDESLKRLRDALSIQQSIFDADKANFGEQNGLADCFLELGWTLALNKNYEQAEKAYLEAIAHYEAVAKTDAVNIAARRQILFTRRHLADIYLAKEEATKALDIYEKCLNGSKEITAGDPQNTDYRHDVAMSFLRIGEAYLKKKNKEKAYENFAAALPIFENLFKTSPENLSRRNDLEKVKTNLRNLQTGYFL